MKYFSNFPKILMSDGKGTSTIATNLLVRANIIPELVKNSALFYSYPMQDGDTPEIIATKYYNNPYRYWIFLYGNNIIDPQWDLALSSKNFTAYLQDKYYESANANNQSVIAYTQSTIKFYQKVTITYDSVSDVTTTNVFNVDQETYANLPVNLVTTKTFSSGNYVRVTQTCQTKSIYDYETEVNESKRETQIINKSFTDEIEERLKSLMNA